MALLKLLEQRFKTHMERHETLKWQDVQVKLEQNKALLKVLQAMEDSGGEPDVVAYDAMDGCYVFMDCAPQSPVQRRSLCYDQAALEGRKANKPIGNAVGSAGEMGIPDFYTFKMQKPLETPLYQ